MENQENNASVKKHHKIILAIGLFCIIFGVIFQISLLRKSAIDVAFVGNFVLIMIGVIFTYFACISKVYMWKFFLGLFFSLSGLVLLVLESIFEDYSIARLWPFVVFIAGFSLALSAVFAKKKITASILLPSLFLIFMGIIFLFFSLDIVKKSFISVVVNFLPWLFIIAGAVLFGTFFYVQSGKQHINLDSIEDNDEE